MMREIVDHQYSSDFAPHIHSTLHAAKRRERLGNLRGWDAASLRNDDRRHRIQDVMPARGGQRKFSKQLSMMRDHKPHDFAIDREVTGHPIVPSAQPVRFNRAKSLFRRASQAPTRIFRIVPTAYA